jgi:iron complex outermembrane recepter protein
LSQEIRYAGNITPRLSGVVGVHAISQSLWTSPFHLEESGSDQWRFSQSSNTATAAANWKTPGLLDGYGIKTYSILNTSSSAVFGQVDWEVIKGLHVLPGLRYNADSKKLSYTRETFGGLQTTNAALLAIKRGVYSDQAFKANVNNTNVTGQITVAFKASDKINTYATYSTSYKPIGVNLGGLPSNADGTPKTELATIKPEYVTHYEFGLKTTPFQHATANITFYNTDIKDYQTNVQSPELGVNRGYLANAEKVRVVGAEFDGSVKAGKHLIFNTAVAYTEGKYISFTNAPLPLEETGKTENGVQVAFKDISGGDLPGISKWAGSVGAEAVTNHLKFVGQEGKFFLAIDGYYRSAFSSSPTPSKYLNISEYGLVNARLGFRATAGFSAFIWGRNILNKNYFEQLLPAAGNAGHYGAVLGDPQTYGITLRYSF